VSLRHGSSQDHDGGKAPARVSRRALVGSRPGAAPAPVLRREVKGVGRHADRLYDPETGRRRAAR
jgi:hypothetical protein